MEKKTRNSKPRIDLSNQLFGRLKPLYYIKGGKWHCQCQCEDKTELDVDTRNLRNGHTKSCGCLQKEKAKENVKDMSNFETENIKVLKRNGSDSQNAALWTCLCKKCGKTFVARGSSLRNGDTQSCGCIHSLNEQAITKMLLENNVEFATQYTFQDLKGINGGALRFDFAIFKNGVLSHLIEYNGLQHYEKPQGTWEKEFDNLIYNDNQKIQYCKDHNIELRIIKYNQEYSINDLI